MSTPRPSGAQANSPAPWCAAAGSSSASASRASREYSACTDVGAAEDHRVRARSAAVASCQPGRPDEPHVAHPPGRHRRIGDGQRLVQRDVRIPAGQLPQVEIVGAQPAQQPVQPAQQRPAPGAAAMRAVGEQAASGDDEVVARHGAPQQAGEHVLRDAAAIAVGGLHQGPAGLDEHAQLLGRRIAVGVVAPGHGAQADPRHLQPTAAHPSSLHVGQPKRAARYWAARRARPLRRSQPEGRVRCGAVTFSAHVHEMIYANGTNQT